MPAPIKNQEPKDAQFHLAEWERAKARDDIFEVKRYIYEHPDAPAEVLDDAKGCLGRMKQAEVAAMEADPSGYDRRRFFALINLGIITVDELVERGLTTQEAFKAAMERDEFLRCNPIPWSANELVPNMECGDDVTDVILLGMPSAGKTCVLMGLLGSGKYDWNNAIADGKYGYILSTYRDNHLLPGRTHDNQFASIHGTVTDSKGGKHRVNLIELSGVQFLGKVAVDPDKEMTLENMVGSVAAELLRNDNRKIFFIVIDPMVNVIQLGKQVTRIDENDNEYEGTVIYEMPQKIVIQKITNILGDPANAKVMEKVDALHFIAAKWDVAERAGKDVNEVMANYMMSYKRIHDLCLSGRRWGCKINKATDFEPQIYTYSLGRFYVGGTFCYDPAYSDKLMGAITDAVSEAANRRRRWYRRLSRAIFGTKHKK